MIEHVTDLLGAYYDGELRGKRLRDTVAHLRSCEHCRLELDKLKALSSMLAESPAPSGLRSEDSYVTKMALQLPRKQDEPVSKRVFNLGWRAAPVGILGVWAFLQSLLLVSGVIFLLMQLGFNLEPLTSLITPSPWGARLGTSLGFEGGGVDELSRTALNVLGNGGPLGWGSLLYLGLTLTLGLLYCSWLASWWVRQRQIRPA
jgi:hypothetical protein